MLPIQSEQLKDQMKIYLFFVPQRTHFQKYSDGTIDFEVDQKEEIGHQEMKKKAPTFTWSHWSSVPLARLLQASHQLCHYI